MNRVVGFREWLPEEAMARRDMESHLLGVLRQACYQEVRIPLLTPAADEGGYRLMRDDGQVVALRHDFTRPVAAMARGSLKCRPRPLRLSYAGPVFRPTEPHAGLAGERWQVGAELLGASCGPEAEIVPLAAEGVRGLVAGGNACIVAGDVTLTRRVLERAGLDTPSRKEALRLLRDRNVVALKALVEGRCDDVGRAGALLELLTYAGTGREIENLWVNSGGRALDLEPLFSLAGGWGGQPTFALGLAPQLPYYTGLVFEIYVEDHPHPVARGGRYDALASCDGGGETAAGFAWDIDNLLAVACTAGVNQAYASIH